MTKQPIPGGDADRKKQPPVRVLIYTGKGGVGKTTVAAATAVACAQRGLRTVVVSGDAAHSLGDCFGMGLEPEPREIAPDLWAEEISSLREMERHWKVIQEFLAEVLAWHGLDSVTSEELAILPGSEELFSLLRIKEHYDSGLFDVIVVDAAPTGETLRLLGLPDAMRWWMQRIFPTVRNVMKYVRPVVRRASSMPVADDGVFAAVESMGDQVRDLRALMCDPQVTSTRIVFNYERMVIKEAQRSLTYLNLFGYNVDCLIANRVMATGQQGPWRNTQRECADSARQSFSPLPILEAPLFEEEKIGIDQQQQVAKAIFGERDPTAFFYQGLTQRLSEEDGHPVITLALPFSDDCPVDVSQQGDELTLQVGWYKRSIILPTSFARLSATAASVHDSQLDVTFS